jgi:hypothetical protein
VNLKPGWTVRIERFELAEIIETFAEIQNA